jgi:hypothetical protein
MNEADWLSSHDPSLIMTEQEWVTCDDPQAMLRLFHQDQDNRQVAGYYISDRKRRLFACGLCRLAWDRLADGRSRRAVEVAERYADGEATEQEFLPLSDMTHTGCCTHEMGQCRRVLTYTRECDLSPATQADLLRCVVGNPWESLHFSCMKCGKPTEGRRGLCGHGGPEGVCQGTGVLALPSWLTRCPRCCGRKHKVVSSEGTAVPCAACRGRGSVALWLTDHAHGIAQDAYDSRDWGLLPILADALEDAGCPTRVCPRCFGEPERCPDCVGQPDGCHPKPDCWVPHPILAHLRSPGPHARGCHVLDLILGKS